MAKTGFENLSVYQFAEEIANLVWEVVLKWDSFLRVQLATNKEPGK